MLPQEEEAATDTYPMLSLATASLCGLGKGICFCGALALERNSDSLVPSGVEIEAFGLDWLSAIVVFAGVGDRF